MVPDFLYFTLLDPYFNAGHLWWGIFVYDIPLSLLLAFLYHNVVRQALIAYSPKWISGRLRLFGNFNWNTYFRQHYLVVISSVIIGVLSHLFLDAFTHGEGVFVELLPALQGDVTVLHHQMKMWYLMQYISSIVGLPLLLYFFLKIPMTKKVSRMVTQQKAGFWLLVVVASIMILLGNEYLHHINCKGLDYLAVAMGGLFYGLIVVVLWYYRYSSRSTR
ncbi:uncharacterized protein DUF4184 [Chitinophaga niastensis]|uniref:Uncharacterized protein DUF4184 n=2 Tax=Chitinophaga niastensis TaxID=536980 RepID=A0A2P8HUQ5_CHINA|nr:uncharacterized protein DUF4184 [Chitinophaga niastensis]